MQGKDKEAKEDAAEADAPTEAAPAPVALVPKLSPTELLRQAAAKRAAAFFKVPLFTLLPEFAVWPPDKSHLSPACENAAGAPVLHQSCFCEGVVKDASPIAVLLLLLLITLQTSLILDVLSSSLSAIWMFMERSLSFQRGFQQHCPTEYQRR